MRSSLRRHRSKLVLAAPALAAAGLLAGGVFTSTSTGHSASQTPPRGLPVASYSPSPPYHRLPPGHPHAGGPAKAVDDAYRTPDTGTLAVPPQAGVLANDQGAPLQIVSHTEPADGSLSLSPDGSFEYVPGQGFTGQDSFTYTVSNAVHLYTDELPTLGTYGGVQLNAGGFGSSVYPVPGHSDEVFGLEDRGPNVETATGHSVEPIPSYDPAIGRFRLEADGKAVLEQKIPLTDSSGHPFSGLENSQNPTGEGIEDLQGQMMAADPDGFDPEGLVALPDGSFWVSDEDGPFIVHFSSTGRELERLSPFNGTLPQELANRVPNRGMEGLTITPDGQTLVGIMQSSLQQKDLNGANAKKDTPLRIVTYGLRTHAVHEYLYLLHEPATTGTAVSEIAALSDNTFVVDERDGNFPGPGTDKKLWKIELSGATDVGPSAHVPGAVYRGGEGGLLIAGKTIEAAVLGQTTPEAQATLAADHIKPVQASLFLDVNRLLLELEPQAKLFSHDKIEGVGVLEGGRRIVISNDSDFGIEGVTNQEAPWQLKEKLTKAGVQDNGEYLEIEMEKLPAATSTGTVTIDVTQPQG